MGRLQGRVAIVTGSSRGIGKATVRRLAEEGAKACVADMDQAAMGSAVEDLNKEGLDVIGLNVDITNEDQVNHMVSETLKRWGRIDILVNNAGIIQDNLLFKMTNDNWEKVMRVHLTGAFYCSRAVQKYMVDQQYGRIINLSSTSALGNRGQANYATVKAGLQGFTKTLAIELGKFGITCNAVAPGFIETEMTRATAARLGIEFEDFLAEQAKQIPAGKAGQPKDVANAILFFASEESAYVNGQVLYVAGGPKD